ncbi:bacillithiol biosynthesis cysteine-adding enzyme BshC [Halobacillus campisalis]|uniref:Putative cysteine ligase BshC n=1 Tax=Halobacillus campisalis TaxID=435909 RepID=A0ABW2K2J6_9BACI|nr:bacillithiol biosynthesis cysteine-adding enzyme BshC [Halobacillus campisalis]
MRIDPINFSDANPLVADYKADNKSVHDKFDFNPNNESDWLKRAEDIQGNHYKREELTEVLTQLNDRWNASAPTFQNIKKLEDKRTTAIVAGQQAGLLTGPLYTVHKIISVLQMTKLKEKELGSPVVPVFWIAGEDHDFAEINHIYMENNQAMEKLQVDTDVNEKSSVSDLIFDEHAVKEWLDKIFNHLQETEYTSSIYSSFKDAIKTSSSFTDFFAKVIHKLFPREGLILLDAHDREIRKLEGSYFKEMVDHNEQIAQGVYSSEQKIKQEGYPISLFSSADDANLFLHKDGERVLLVRDEDGFFKGKKGEVSLSKDDLLSVAEQEPWRLSNNVVTRPLMQELLLPVLGFVGGPGEINYWAALKPAFHTLNLRMPPVVPRLSFTLLDRASDKRLRDYEIDVGAGVQQGTGPNKLNWIATLGEQPIDKLAEEMKKEIENIHKPLRNKAADLGPDMKALADKNLEYIHQSIGFLQKRMLKSTEENYERELRVFDELNLLLRPGGALQERMWSIVPWVNMHGIDVFERMCSRELSFDHTHFVVRL